LILYTENLRTGYCCCGKTFTPILVFLRLFFN